MAKAIVSKLDSYGAVITVREGDNVVTFRVSPTDEPSIVTYRMSEGNLCYDLDRKSKMSRNEVKQMVRKLDMDVAAGDRWLAIQAEAKTDPTLYSTRYEVYCYRQAAAVHALRQAVAAEPDPMDPRETICTAAAELAQIEPPTLEEHPWHRSPGAYWGDAEAHKANRALTERMQITAVFVATGKIL